MLSTLKKYAFLFGMFFLPLLLVAQKPKQKVVPFKAWSYPEISIPHSNIGIVIDEQKLPVTLLSDPLDNEQGIVVTASGNIPLDGIEKLAFRTIKLVPVDDADLIVTLVATPAKFQTSAQKIDDGQSDGPVNFAGALDYFYGMACRVTDRNNTIIYEQSFEGRNALISLDGFASSQKARQALKAMLWKDLPNLMDQGDLARINAVTHEFIPQVMQALDFQRQKENLYLYGFNSKKDAQLEKVNVSIAEIKKAAALEDDANYEDRLNALLSSKIEQWSTIKLKYDPSDKKQKKIIWGLLANICAAQYAMGAYETSLDTFEEIAKVDYRQDFTYLEEMPAKRIAQLTALSEKNNGTLKDFRNLDYRATNDHKNVLFINADGLIAGDEAVQDIGRQLRAEAFFSILAMNAYYAEFQKLVKKFTEQDKKTWVGFASVNPNFARLVEKIKKQAESLKGVDLSGFNVEDKILVAELRDELIDQFDDLNRELALEEINSISDFNKLDLAPKIHAYILVLGESFESHNQKIIDTSISTLMNRHFISYNEALKNLPLIELLIDELTAEGGLTHAQDAAFYEKLFKRYKKHYASLFFDANEFTRYMHHTEKSRFGRLLREYYEPLYKANADEINGLFKNYADRQRAIDVFYVLLRPTEVNGASASKR